VNTATPEVTTVAPEETAATPEQTTVEDNSDNDTGNNIVNDLGNEIVNSLLGGCGSVVGFGTITVVAIACAVGFVSFKKKED